jgi:transposase-like protein
MRELVYPIMECPKCREKKVEVIGEFVDGQIVTSTFMCINCHYTWREKTDIDL